MKRNLYIVYQGFQGNVSETQTFQFLAESLPGPF